MITIQWKGPPRWWNEGRAGSILYVAMHDTEGSEGSTSAESGVDYDKRRPDSVSTHVMVDTDTALREVQDADTAYAAFPTGNAHGIHIEMCHSGPWDLNEPNDAATFDNAAQVAAQLCLAHGLPAVHLSVDEVASLTHKGICGHWDITRAYPADGGDHSDPDYSGGQPTGFPWSTFINRVANYMGGGQTAPSTGDSDIMIYTFAGLPDCPASLKSSNDAQFIVTDGLGRYFRRDYASWQYGDATVGGPATHLTLGKNSGQLPAGTKFVDAFAALTGGCTYQDIAGVTGDGPFFAPGWPVGSGGGGSLQSHSHSVSTTGTTGDIQPL